MKNKLLYVSIIFILFSQCKCNSISEAKRVAKMAIKLGDAFTGFSETIQIIDKLISIVINDTRITLTKDIQKGTLEEVTEKWEKKWRKIGSKIKKLEEKYDDVCRETNKYFEKLRELETNTVNVNQRQIIKGKTDSKEIEFNNAKTSASAQVLRMKQMGEMGSDFHNMLLQDVMLTQIGYRITELNEIEASARDICNRLQTFANTGTAILK